MTILLIEKLLIRIVIDLGPACETTKTSKYRFFMYWKGKHLLGFTLCVVFVMRHSKVA